MGKAFDYKTRANAYGATNFHKWAQDAWLRKRMRNRGIADPFGMEAGFCYPASAEWLIMARSGSISGFPAHMELPDVYETMQSLKISQVKGRGGENDIDAYLQMNGLHSVGCKNYEHPSVRELAWDLTTYNGYYIVAVLNGRFVTKDLDGHAIAVEVNRAFRVFDPNYGVARFAHSDDLCGFLIDLLQSYYGPSPGFARIWRYS